MAFFFDANEEYKGYLRLKGDLNDNSIEFFAEEAMFHRPEEGKFTILAKVKKSDLPIEKLTDPAAKKWEAHSSGLISINLFSKEHKEWKSKEKPEAIVKPTPVEKFFIECADRLNLPEGKSFKGKIILNSISKDFIETMKLASPDGYEKFAIGDFEILEKNSLPSIEKGVGFKRASSGGGESVASRIDSRFAFLCEIFQVPGELSKADKFAVIKSFLKEDSTSLKILEALLK